MLASSSTNVPPGGSSTIIGTVGAATAGATAISAAATQPMAVALIVDML
jgi:hypothetical protein